MSDHVSDCCAISFNNNSVDDHLIEHKMGDIKAEHDIEFAD